MYGREMCDRWAAANAPTVVKQKEKYPFIISGQDAIQKEGVNSGYGLLMTGAQKRGGGGKRRGETQAPALSILC